MNDSVVMQEIFPTTITEIAEKTTSNVRNILMTLENTKFDRRDRLTKGHCEKNLSTFATNMDSLLRSSSTKDRAVIEEIFYLIKDLATTIDRGTYDFDNDKIIDAIRNIKNFDSVRDKMLAYNVALDGVMGMLALLDLMDFNPEFKQALSLSFGENQRQLSEPSDEKVVV